MKKLLSLFLCLILLFGLLPLTAPARAASEGDWEYSISGNSATITKYIGNGGSVSIPSNLGGKPVIHIGRSAFSRCTSLTLVTIPNSVTSIGSNAFYGCTDLISVIIPESVITIGSFAFEECIGLTNITIPKSVTSIGSFAFEDCDGIKRVDISDLAAWCTIEFENHSSNPLDYAHALYLNGKIVTKLTVPNGTKSIGSYAFSGCSTIQSLTIPESVTEIGEGAFRGCSELTSIIIPSGVTSISDRTFEDCSGLTSISIPSGVTSIGSSAFEGCEMLIGLEIPAGVTAINESSFEDCSCLTNVTIPSGVTSIGFAAFDGCERLVSVTIPKGVKSIGGHAFAHCSGLTEVRIPSGVVSIGDYAFALCSNLTSVSLPTSLKSIGESAFACCDLTSLTIPENVTVIGEDAFYACDKITSVGPIGSGCSIQFGWTESIPDYAFSGCDTIRTAIIPDTIVEIRHSAFSGCSDLKQIWFGGSEEQWNEILIFGSNEPLKKAGMHFGYKAGDLIILDFGSCGDNMTWTLDQKGTLTVSGSGAINSNAFCYSSYCDMIHAAVLESGVTSIGSYAFYGCTGLTTVTIPSSVASIGYSAFSGCTCLTDVFYGGTEEDWAKISIYGGNDPLTTATIHYAGPLVLDRVKADKTTAAVGEKITWTATASGGFGALQYYFAVYKDGSPVAKRGYSTTRTYSYTPTEPGTYKVRVYVKDANETKLNKLSAAVTVTQGPPVVTTQPANQTVAAGATATFKVVASGNGLSYQWQYSKDGGTTWYNKTEATSTSCTVTAKTAYDGFRYRCRVKNEVGTVYSNPAELTVLPKPVITTQPANQTVAAGATATFKAVASGTGLTYQWQYSKDGGTTWYNKTGATETSCTVTAKTSYDGFLYRCKVKNSAGTVYSSSAKLTVTSSAAPVISSVKADKTAAAAGTKITWTATASGGTGTLQYYFILYKDGTKVKTRSYSTTNTFSYTPAEAGSYKVKVYVKDAEGTKVSKTSSQVAVTLGPPAIISVKAGKTSSAVGEEITWTATAVGSEQPLKYYFILYKDGVKLKTRSYSTTNTFSYTPTEAGSYKVKVYVKDATGAKVYKNSAKLTVTD